MWHACIWGGLMALALTACGADPQTLAPGSGAEMPEVALTGLSDEVQSSTTALRGSALIVNFWATWCAPCRTEMPALQRLSHRLAGQGVRVIGITTDTDLNLAREFVRAQGLTFPNYVDGFMKTMQRRLGVQALPETVLVAADGTIRARIAGARDWDSPESLHLIAQALGLRQDASLTPGAARRP